MLIELILYVIVSYLFMYLIGYVYAMDAVEMGTEVGVIGLMFVFAPFCAPIMLFGIIRESFFMKLEMKVGNQLQEQRN